MKKTLLAIAAVALLAVPQTFANEAPINQDMPKPAFHNFKRFERPKFSVEKLDQLVTLNDEQKVKIQAIIDKSEATAKPIKEKMGEKKKEMKNIFDQKLTVTERQELLKPIHQEMRELHKQLREIRKDAKQEIDKVLTDKQLKKLEKIKQEHRKNFKKRGTHHRGHRPPMIDRPTPYTPVVEAE